MTCHNMWGLNSSGIFSVFVGDYFSASLESSNNLAMNIVIVSIMIIKLFLRVISTCVSSWFTGPKYVGESCYFSWFHIEEK